MPLLDLGPRSFGEFEAAGGGRGLQAALAAWPVAVIQEVARSGLRGRGGAGFPTGEEVRAVGAGPRYAVCSAAEGEPATFKDRLLLRTNPYQLLEGLAIAAYAVGAERAHVGLKETFTTEIQALTRVLGEMRDADALGGVAVEVVLGPDLYLFGEETELEEVIEGRPPLPRAARPFIQGCSPGPGRQPHAGQLRRDLGQRAPRPGRRPPTGCGPMAPKALRARCCSPSAGRIGGKGCSSCRLGRRCVTWWRSRPAARHRAGRRVGAAGVHLAQRRVEGHATWFLRAARG